MTGVGELRQTTVVSATPRTFRVSVFGGRTQLDIELPADVPIALIVPELAQLISSRDIHREDTADALENKRDRWVLTRLATAGEIDADHTLAAAGSHDGDLLGLTLRRALQPAELFDDVVDAVARLNREGYATWGRGAAQWMAYAGVALAVAAIDVLLLRDTDLWQRTLLAVQALAVIAGLVIAGTVAKRFYAESRVASALGWASLPLVFGVSSVFAERLPASGQPWALTLVCAVTAAAALACWRIIRTGRMGFVGVAVAFTVFTAVAAAQTEFHWSTNVVDPVLASCGVLLPTMVEYLSGWLRRRALHTDALGPAPTTDPFADPFDRSAPRENQRRAADRARARVPSVEQVAAAVARFQSTRSALFAAAAAVAVTGTAVAISATAVSGAPEQLPWSVIASRGSAAPQSRRGTRGGRLSAPIETLVVAHRQRRNR